MTTGKFRKQRAVTGILALYLGLNGYGAVVVVDVHNFSMGIVVNRVCTVTLTKPQGPVVAGPWVITGDSASLRTDTNGVCNFNNVLALGEYRLDVSGNPSRSFPFSLSSTSGVYNIVQLLGTNAAIEMFYDTAQIDAMLAGINVGAATNVYFSTGSNNVEVTTVGLTQYVGVASNFITPFLTVSNAGNSPKLRLVGNPGVGGPTGLFSVDPSGGDVNISAGNLRFGEGIQVSGTTRLGAVIVTNAGSSTAVANLGVDLSGNVVTNVSAIGGGGGGSVSNVAMTVTGTGLTLSGSPITGSGTFAISTPSPLVTNNASFAITISNKVIVSRSASLDPLVLNDNTGVGFNVFSGQLSLMGHGFNFLDKDQSATFGTVGTSGNIVWGGPAKNNNTASFPYLFGGIQGMSNTPPSVYASDRLVQVPMMAVNPYYDQVALPTGSWLTNSIALLTLKDWVRYGWSNAFYDEGMWNGRSGAHYTSDATRFQQGVQVVVDYAHANGFKIGTYLAHAPNSCGGAIGTMDANIWDDMTDISAFGFDFLKIDNCGPAGLQSDGLSYDPSDYKFLLRRMALFPEANQWQYYANHRKPMFLLTTETYNGGGSSSFPPYMLLHNFNSYENASPPFSLVTVAGLFQNSQFEAANFWNVRPGHIFRLHGNAANVSLAAAWAQMGLCAVLPAHVIISTNISAANSVPYTNPPVIAALKDPYVNPGYMVSTQSANGCQIWARPIGPLSSVYTTSFLNNSGYMTRGGAMSNLVCIGNLDAGSAHTVHANWGQIGIASNTPVNVIDMRSGSLGTSLGLFTNDFLSPSIASLDSGLYMFSALNIQTLDYLNLTGASSATSVRNLGIDASGAVTTNVAPVGGSGSQTPWTSTEDAARFGLTNFGWQYSSNTLLASGAVALQTNSSLFALQYYGTSAPTSGKGTDIANGAIGGTNIVQWDAPGVFGAFILRTNGNLKIGLPSSATTVANLGIDANGVITSNASPVGAVGSATDASAWHTNGDNAPNGSQPGILGYTNGQDMQMRMNENGANGSTVLRIFTAGNNEAVNIAMGASNGFASSLEFSCSVIGGAHNSIAAGPTWASIFGGGFNSINANGNQAFIGGGASNQANGAFSVAMGQKAIAANDNSFVFNLIPNLGLTTSGSGGDNGKFLLGTSDAGLEHTNSGKGQFRSFGNSIFSTNSVAARNATFQFTNSGNFALGYFGTNPPAAGHENSFGSGVISSNWQFVIETPGHTRDLAVNTNGAAEIGVALNANGNPGTNFSILQAGSFQTVGGTGTNIFGYTLVTNWGLAISNSNGAKGTWLGTNGNADIGNNLTATNGTDFIGELQGTITGGNATAGYYGEIVTNKVASGSAVSLTTATGANVTSISLTAGDWNVSGNVNFSASTATVTGTSAGISTTSATVPTDGSEVFSGVQVTLLSENDSVTLPPKQINVTTTTTVFLVGKCTFSAGSVSAFGSILARRIR